MLLNNINTLRNAGVGCSNHPGGTILFNGLEPFSYCHFLRPCLNCDTNHPAH
jgi:hypothetical protein